MTLKEVEDYFKTCKNFVDQTGLVRTCWFVWKRKGFVPIKSQFKIEKITGGQLKANYDEAKCL